MAVLQSSKYEGSKPQTMEEYMPWFESEFECNLRDYANYYDIATSHLKHKLEISQFWQSLGKELPNINDRYKMQKGCPLMARTEAPDILIKSLESLTLKSFRKNVLNNPSFPEPPSISGWIYQDNWFTSIHDILRTTIVVKYLDGVEFLLDELKTLAKQKGCRFDYSLEAREEGYYAAHGALSLTLDVIDQKFNPIPTEIEVEIQITTELQEVIKTLLHKHYEENRKRIAPSNRKWQWDYNCDEFSSNYLGHIVHYVEGRIVAIRDKQANN